MAEARIKPRKVCANCRNFEPRDPSAPWPRAGVPVGAQGQCKMKRLESAPRWRNGTDWCDRFEMKEAER